MKDISENIVQKFKTFHAQ